MGTETVVYLTDNRAIEEMQRQRDQNQQNLKAYLESQQQIINYLPSDNEEREKEIAQEYAMQEMKEREKKNKQREEENRQKEMQLITQTNIEKQKQIAAILKIIEKII